MQVEMNRRRALAGLATIPVAAGMVAMPAASASEDDRHAPWHPMTFDEFLRSFQRRCGTSMQDMADCFAGGERDQILSEPSRRPAVGKVGLHPYALFYDGAIAIVTGFVNDTMKAERAYYGIIGDLATEGIVTVAAGSTPCYHGFSVFALAHKDDVRRIIAPRVEESGFEWDSWQSEMMPWHDWRQSERAVGCTLA